MDTKDPNERKHKKSERLGLAYPELFVGGGALNVAAGRLVRRARLVGEHNVKYGTIGQTNKTTKKLLMDDYNRLSDVGKKHIKDMYTGKLKPDEVYARLYSGGGHGFDSALAATKKLYTIAHVKHGFKNAAVLGLAASGLIIDGSRRNVKASLLKKAEAAKKVQEAGHE